MVGDWGVGGGMDDGWHGGVATCGLVNLPSMMNGDTNIALNQDNINQTNIYIHARGSTSGTVVECLASRRQRSIMTPDE